MIIVDAKNPTRLQVHACRTEAERFNKDFNNRNPMVTDSYYLSMLKASRLNTVKWKTPSSSSTLIFQQLRTYTLSSLCTLLSLILIYMR